ncbi:hypothetical protein TVAG_395120 [Trichomonas vaginalis G3]|uniref:Uncharacterized protein n=1 Tax=Trichomonas vaginalis (strain ATCC PRA-98 / G3) TaxID=412133 RepID=A2EDH6_TRIV3|nr:hypothetical protein TVAGG3_0724400 [Trichomonas vaginalis G3]EAY09340.1 hypothetical protein TVAG_395120 [Trichomonas vaginalis G3]KAI5510804.1 hypothetical protein TVAGG3_0724400 [Trichomonas vaginalis G3]|eukprot:XP_001321563.1 hypothetical protein [Trichomonas vaginalis G3]
MIAQNPPQPTNNVINDINGFNWASISSIDIRTLSQTKDRHTLSQIQEEFLDSTTFYNQNMNEVQKLFSILQIIIENNKDSIRKLKSMVKKLNRENSALKNQVETKKSLYSQKCPICLKDLPSLSKLDAHMFQRHQNAAIIWQNLRTPHKNEDQVFSSITMALQPQPSSVNSSNEIQEAIKMLTTQQKKTTRQLAGFKKKIDDLKSTITIESLASTAQILANKKKKEQENKYESNSSSAPKKKHSDNDEFDHVVTIRPNQITKDNVNNYQNNKSQEKDKKQTPQKQESKPKVNQVPFDQKMFTTSSESEIKVETSVVQRNSKPQETPKPKVEESKPKPAEKKEEIQNKPKPVENPPPKVTPKPQETKPAEQPKKPVTVVVTTTKPASKQNSNSTKKDDSDDFLSEPDMDKSTREEAPSSSHPNDKMDDEDIEFEEFHNTPAQRIRHSDSMEEPEDIQPNKSFPQGFNVDDQDSFSDTGVITGTTTVPPPNLPFYDDDYSEPSHKGRVRNFSETGEVNPDPNYQTGEQYFEEEEDIPYDDPRFNQFYNDQGNNYNDQYNDTYQDDNYGNGQYYNPDEEDDYYANTYNPDEDKYYENTYNPEDEKYYSNNNNDNHDDLMYSDYDVNSPNDDFQATTTKTEKVNYYDDIPHPDGMTKRQYVHALASSSINSSTASPGPRGIGKSWKPQEEQKQQNPRSPPKQDRAPIWEDDSDFDGNGYDTLPELPDVSSSPQPAKRKGLLNL